MLARAVVSLRRIVRTRPLSPRSTSMARRYRRSSTASDPTEVMYSRFPGVPAGSEIGRTWGQALADMTHHVADRWARAPWAPKEDVARSLTASCFPPVCSRPQPRSCARQLRNSGGG